MAEVLLLLLFSFSYSGLCEDIVTDVYPYVPHHKPPGLFSGELASALYTFQDHACGGSTLTIRCPRGSTISVQFAVWGRQQPSTRLCPRPRIELPLALMPDPPPTEPVEDVNCLSSRSLPVVIRDCQDRRRCHVKAIPQTFRDDPCPGTGKYLEVAYKCKPHEFHTHLSCEGQDMVLVCPKKNTRIALYSAKFGRSVEGETACPNTEPVYKDCFSSTAYEVVLNRCHGRGTCTIHADTAVFGQPCGPTTRKYLHVVYSCVPKKILKSLSLEPSLDGRLASQDYANDPRLDPDRAQSEEAVEPPKTFEVIDKSSKEEKQKPPESDSKVVELRETTVAPPTDSTCTNDTSSFMVGMITSWFTTVNFLKGNHERVVLYLVLGFCGGLLCLLVIIIIKIIVYHKRHVKTLDLESENNDNTNASSTLTRDTIDRGIGTEPRRVNFEGYSVEDNDNDEEEQTEEDVLPGLMFDTQLRLPNGRASRSLTHYYNA